MDENEKNEFPRRSPYARFLECVYDAVLIVDSVDGRIIECNERAGEFFRLSAESLTGRKIGVVVEAADAAFVASVGVRLKEERYALFESLCLRMDGTSFPAEVAVSCLEVKRRAHLCFFVRDITIRKRALSELESAVERLQEHDRARMEFVSNVSHELRTPLTSMIYGVSNMLRGVVGPLSEKAIHYLERLRLDCRRLLTTVNDILDLRQAENNTLVLAKALAPLGAVIRSAVDSLRIQSDSKRQKLTFEGGIPEAFCFCDAQKMERVILNIVGNAVKFTPSEGRIEVALLPGVPKPGVVTIRCRDTGIGIPADKLPKISRRYFRVGNFVKGSGLGLAISRELVELHGGRILFASPVPETGCGTEVSVELPLAETPSLIVAGPKGKETVDELRRTAEICGYKAVSCTCGECVLRECLERKPVAVLLLGGGDRASRECALRIREEIQTKRLPVFLVCEGRLPRGESEFYRSLNIQICFAPVTPASLSVTLAKAVLGKTLGF
ncbi:MAG: PAS domain-containing sensor histidine kinase [Kiritimatiellae bacterium]|nr:PAS domain-containing sensor histidine kinase [Kiritimatiellia bacterium]